MKRVSCGRKLGIIMLTNGAIWEIRISKGKLFRKFIGWFDKIEEVK